jgi:tetratricopeptide (TPR) repeat protein
MTARIACIDGDLSTAEQLLTQDINTDVNNHTSYAHRSFVMARKHDWNHALQDAIKSISIQPSLTGYISKGIALCGKGRIPDARAVFDVASMYTNEDSQIVHFLLLIKAIALFNADQHDEAMLLIKELATGCPNADTRACHIVEAYLRVQLGIKALDGARYDKAADHFTVALNPNNLSSKWPIHEIYEDLVVLFGWDLKSLWLIAHQKRCDALLRTGKLQDAVKSYRYMMVSSDENTNADYLDWSNDFKEECSTLCVVSGDAALTAKEYDRAIDLYSAAIDLDYTSDVVFVNRSKAKLGKMLWEDALLDARKVTELNPSSHIGYELTYTALCGAHRYDKAIKAFTIMLSKLDDAPEAQIRDLRQQYVCPSEIEDAIQRAVWIEFEYAPLRLLNTSTGLLCDRAAQINAFKMSQEYMDLVLFPTKDSNVRKERIKDVVATYFRCVLLSHRWEETEALLHDIQDKVVYELNGLGGIAKLQSFCKIARDSGYHWAWMDTCCIDKRSNTELQESVNSMFVWYRHSALTVVYLCDVPPSSQSGALARSVWNERGWTFQEFVAPRVVIFYQKDWSLYLNDRSPNHKESPAIMKELEDATGIDALSLISFRPGMSNARQRLQWASSRVTTLQEDVAYSLFGIFGVHLPVIYGEKKQNALGRLLQEIVARSGDITVLDWIGQASEFNSCLPAHITSYTTSPRTIPSLSEDEIQATISSLRNNFVAVDLALKLYSQLNNTSAARFANCRLHLPCIAFRVTHVGLSYGPSQETRYEVKADGLRDLLIITKEPIVQFLRTRPTQQHFVLVRPWDRSLLELPDFADLPNIGDNTENEEVVDPESQALRFLVRLGHPFGAFLLARQRGGEYKRVASDHDIIAQLKDVATVQDLMDIRTIEIL